MRPGLRQSGVALVAAIFLVVILAVLGAVAVRLAGVQQQTTTLALLGARAYHAALSGLEWGAHQALVNGTCGSTTFALTESALTGFSVQVSCTSTGHAEGASTTTVYHIVAFARAGVYGEPDYVSRRVQASITDG